MANTPYRIIRKPGIRHLYLRIKEGELLVSAGPKISEATIAAFVRSKESWIHKHLSQTRAQSKLTDAGALVYLQGIAYPVHIREDESAKKAYMSIEGKRAVFYLQGTAEHETLLHLRDSYYKVQCQHLITPIVEHYAQKMKLHPEALTYRHNRSRWGSCSSKNRLSLNTRLMMLPEIMIVYVVVHELAHIRHKNHSHNFWELVEQYMPDYKILRKNIRIFEPFL